VSAGRGNRQTVLDLAKAALISALADRPDSHVDGDGRAHRLEQNLIDSITIGQLRRATMQIEKGDGGELRPQDPHRPPMHSAFSSAALEVNSFAPWISREEHLLLGGYDGFESLEFERKCPIWPEHQLGHPNLDLVAYPRDGGIVAVESKCTEHLGIKLGRFEPAYEDKRDALSEGWLRRYEELLGELDRPLGRRLYSHFDAAQMVKHYLGLKRTFPHRQITLLYLYWEPKNAGDEVAFQRHRDEVENFSNGLDDPNVTFAAQSYPELWSDWAASVDQQWVRSLVSELRARYVIPI
jgi:hypothetical protein